jgi:GTP-binding protein HflX
MFERPRAGEKGVLVHLDLGRVSDPEEVEEFRLLARSAGAEIVGQIGGSRATPDRRLFVGSGKADELKMLVEAEQAELVIFNHALSPGQERNLERHLQCRVLDRSGLILDIFAQRARSFEGKLQVELAQLTHLSTRLVRGWTHLERQKGGIGLRGPGETQLESDRRLLGKRIATLNKRLERIVGQRAQGRRARDKAELPTVSLVGYTNAGKSTLFNSLTQAGVFQADQLFATLDPTLRRLETPDGPAVILADTVGFINHLPHELVAAFRSTLEETRGANCCCMSSTPPGHGGRAASPMSRKSWMRSVPARSSRSRFSTRSICCRTPSPASNATARARRGGSG